MIKVTYHKHAGRLFRRRVTIMPRPRMLTEEQRGYCLNYAELQHWAKARKHETWAIQRADGTWKFCAADIPREYRKKWLDYYATRH